MPLMTFSVHHGYTFTEAQRRLETAVHELTSQFGTLVRRVEWSTDRLCTKNRVIKVTLQSIRPIRSQNGLEKDLIGLVDQRVISLTGLFVQSPTDRSQVRLEGIGYWIVMQVDAQAVHVSADIPALSSLLGGSVTTRLKEMIEGTFQPKLPGG